MKKQRPRKPQRKRKTCAIVTILLKLWNADRELDCRKQIHTIKDFKQLQVLKDTQDTHILVLRYAAAVWLHSGMESVKMSLGNSACYEGKNKNEENDQKKPRGAKSSTHMGSWRYMGQTEILLTIWKVIKFSFQRKHSYNRGQWGR